ncbi:hypothetical protein [Mesorhizobium sp. CAU 1732]|uniref:hypothetical protein n=1 Tax=Mesorhizobium sp. CAU 1732 TaxID=3140358 RepID=UPI003261B4A6
MHDDAAMMPVSGRTHARSNGFLTSRWNGTAPFGTLFWRDMMVIATLISLAMLGVSLAVLEMGYPTWLAIAAFLLPIPWNTFLVACVFRTVDAQSHRYGFIAKLAAILWFLIAAIL